MILTTMAVFTNTPLSVYSRLPVEEVLPSMQSGREGLLTGQAQQRLQQLGPNSIEVHKKRNELVELLYHFRSPLMIILLVAATISFSVGETINASIIIVMVLVSVVIDYFQERDARNAAERLKETVKNKVSVLRNGVATDLLPEELVPGDVVLLRTYCAG